MGTLSSIIVPGMDAGCWRLSDAFPQQDTGQIVGITEAAQDISFPEARDADVALRSGDG